MTAHVRIRRGETFKEYRIACGPDMTAAELLDRINEEESDPVEWECSCRQKCCGACAMVINGRPALACNTFVRDTGTEITLEPLRKFPLIKDLKVDRSGMDRLIEELKVFHEEDGKADGTDYHRQYMAASCLQCGLCLEACPNYNGKDLYGGAMLANSIFRILDQETDRKKKKELTGTYRRTQFKDCTKTLSCAEVCPVNLPLVSTFSRLNACAVKELLRLPQ